MHYDMTPHGLATAALAFAIAFVFACSSGSLRMKAPEETEWTLAHMVTDRYRRKARK